MAVVAPLPFKSNLGSWGSSDSAIYPAESPEPMTDIMSYQYPPPPQNGADMEMPPSGYYQVSPSAHSAMDMRPSPDSSLPHRERRDSMSKAMKIKRSLSTPNVRPPQAQPPQPPPQPPQPTAQEQNQFNLAEKRRNKLGYHRTSVACGHCRRRKIRCIPSPADVQGRCVNCIRLKKECSFYPVDQQPPQDTRQKSASRSSVGPKIASASSSPAMQSGLPSDMHGQQPYPQLTMPSIQNMAPPMKPPGSESFPPEAKMPSGASGARNFDYGHAGMTNWMSPDANPNSSKPGDLNATWRSYPTESPITPAFSPYTPHAPPPSATWTTPVSAEPSSREDMHWSPYSAPPTRSLSFGAESMTSHPQQYPPISQVGPHSGRPYDRKSGSVPSDMYQPPNSTTIPGVETISGTAMDHHVSLSAGAAPPPSYETWQQPYPYGKPGDSYGGWYGDQGAHQPQVHHPNEHPPPGSSMYYAER
ncbi:hypothetical protein QBC33DRAFT_328330 [Phialemonium atrogriseum]|uniref:Zn(2)-C6 fungal-type domain-containing protein n=1 Tax=Phialemonium atrogriseum TaxID=1093897 RepID=A0AAJ0C3S5_9PEZI|nr:uncharacterized protein QBC33DRAFT_328330 [Phialemonium atrogriseum]KAK1769613.1 hypothetical protein QBC33DRAFT_328330 [Phialemonium atrogriseum]